MLGENYLKFIIHLLHTHGGGVVCVLEHHNIYAPESSGTLTVKDILKSASVRRTSSRFS